MADIFPPPGLVMPKPDWGFKQSPESDIIQEKMGDGYEVRYPNGLNYLRENFSPTWSELDELTARAAYEFLKARQGWKAVLWAHPLSGVIYKVIPESLSITYDTYNNAVLDVEFRQDFNPG